MVGTHALHPVYVSLQLVTMHKRVKLTFGNISGNF
jgi:hypothetical protein